MAFSRSCFLMVLAVAAVLAFAGETRDAEKINLLLVGGRGHDWRGFHKVISKVLEKTGDFTVTLTDKLDDLKPETIKEYTLVLFYGSGGNFTDPLQEQGLDTFVNGGGALAGVHATDAFKKSDVYWKLLGGRFIGHGGGKFTMRIQDRKHPITAPLVDFEISDETYRDRYHPEAKLHFLAKIDRGKEQQSMVWVQQHGKGRIFNTTLGHGKAAWTNPHFQRLVVRGLYWAAGRKPKDPPVN